MTSRYQPMNEARQRSPQALPEKRALNERNTTAAVASCQGQRWHRYDALKERRSSTDNLNNPKGQLKQALKH